LPKFDDKEGSHEPESLTATAHLPGLDIEIVHRRFPDEDAEQISITLKAVPSFDAFGRYLETMNPFALWVQAMQLAWFPWLQAARAASRPYIAQLPKPGSGR
jgi:hypothetical protein